MEWYTRPLVVIDSNISLAKMAASSVSKGDSVGKLDILLFSMLSSLGMASLEAHPLIFDPQVAGLLQHKLMAMQDVLMSANNDATRKNFKCIDRLQVSSVSKRKETTWKPVEPSH
jgi:hypothetical protein